MADRIALVIGNARYRHVRALAKPINDAKAVAKMLQGLGFEVRTLTDQTQAQFRQEFREFRAKVGKTSIVVIYYAGHGIEVLGSNYLVPVDAKLVHPKTVADVADEAYPVSRVLDDTEAANELQLVILDCCRDDPFGDITRSLKGETRSLGPHRGLAPLPPDHAQGRNSLIAYAAAAGAVAYDGEESDINSPYARALLQHLATPGEDILMAFNRVRGSVIEKTSVNREGKAQAPQQPHYYAGIGIPAIYLAADPGEMHWNEIKSASDPRIFEEFSRHFSGHARAKEAGIRAALLKHQADEWERIKGSNDAEDFQNFVKSYSNAPQAREARERIAALQQHSQSTGEIWRYAVTGFGALATALVLTLKFVAPKMIPGAIGAISALIAVWYSPTPPTISPTSVPASPSPPKPAPTSPKPTDALILPKFNPGEAVRQVLGDCSTISSEKVCRASVVCTWRANACEYSLLAPRDSKTEIGK
jgi:Caspase domain